MFKIQCETARFAGLGRLRCHRCGQATDFPEGASVIFLVLPRSLAVWDSATGVVLHDCLLSPTPASSDDAHGSPGRGA